MRIERWLLYLQQFDYQLKYCPGKQNAADYLSRRMLPLAESDIQTSEASKQVVVHSIITDTAPPAPWPPTGHSKKPAGAGHQHLP